MPIKIVTPAVRSGTKPCIICGTKATLLTHTLIGTMWLCQPCAMDGGESALDKEACELEAQAAADPQNIKLQEEARWARQTHTAVVRVRSGAYD